MFFQGFSTVKRASELKIKERSVGVFFCLGWGSKELPTNVWTIIKTFSSIIRVRQEKNNRLPTIDKSFFWMFFGLSVLKKVKTT